jgi:hypothetical protein
VVGVVKIAVNVVVDVVVDIAVDVVGGVVVDIVVDVVVVDVVVDILSMLLSIFFVKNTVDILVGVVNIADEVSVDAAVNVFFDIFVNFRHLLSTFLLAL